MNFIALKFIIPTKNIVFPRIYMNSFTMSVFCMKIVFKESVKGNL